VPFLIVGDSPQALTVNLSEAGGGCVLRRPPGRRLQPRLGQPAVRHLHRRPPRREHLRWHRAVHDAGDLATPNEQFFARVDRLLQLAAQHGIVVLLDPAETGSFLSVLNANGVAKARDYGRYLARATATSTTSSG
jgi:hypothetical protein